jgi:hypothetical protein
MLECRCWNTDAGTQKLEHRCRNTVLVGNMAIAEMTQTVKVVIDGNRLVWLLSLMMAIGWLVMEHAQENWQKKIDDARAISKWGC